MSESLRDQLQATLGDAYRIERELGGGGMSRVFAAEDATLGRKIVVKVLPHDTAMGVSAERFKREIQTAARLQHPHIVPLLSAGETNGLPFYTMPFVKGESLRARLARGGELSVNEAIHLLRDIAAALAYAHGEGVVHRDIKPDNVIVSGGIAVVTDFGVAKAVDVASTEDGGLKSGLTSLGVALGTPAYMSPEQASADPHVDHRADIYSFGCVAYELLSGASPFAGRPPQHMLAAHVTESPEPLTRRRPTVPPSLAALVMKCLEKRAGDRPQSADELIAALDAIGTPSGGMPPTGERLIAFRRPRARWTAIAAAVVVLGVVGVVWRQASSVAPLSVGATTPIAISPEMETQAAISPDGRLVAYVGATKDGDRIFVRQIDGGRPNVLSGDLSGNHAWPRWSPDQQRISFHANNALFVVPALGGSPKRVIAGGPTHSWSPDGASIVFEAIDGIHIQSLNDGRARRLVDGFPLHSPVISPDGRLLAYVQGTPLTMLNTSTSSIWVTETGGGQPVRVSDSTHVNVSPVWLPDGNAVLYVSNLAGSRDVYQQPIRENGAPVGAPRRMTTALSSFSITVSRDGTRMAYDVVGNYANIWTTTVTPGTAGSLAAARPVTREKQRIEVVRLSRDGQWLVFDSDRAGNFDIYKVRVDGGEPIQLTTNTGNDFNASWSHDGKEIAFHSHRHGTRDIFIVNAEGTAETQVTSGPMQDYAPSWSPDGRKLAYFVVTSTTTQAFEVERDAAGGWSKARRIMQPEAVAYYPTWSPDGSMLAYLSAAAFSGSFDNARLRVMPASGGSSRELGDTLLGPTTAGFVWSNNSAGLYASVRDSQGVHSIWYVPLTGTPRRILSEDATHRFARPEFTTDGRRFFFTLASWESDVYVAELKK